MKHTIARRGCDKGFTLLEILMVVVILGIVAAIVVPRASMATDEARDTGIRRQLQTLRAQIELYRAENHSNDPDMSDWDDLIFNGYLKIIPQNPLNNGTAINGAGNFSGGWIWRDTGTGVNRLYATNGGHTGEYVE